ncbi:PACE efflux transporter [Maridesulfovibrio ferrireducens]|uniref:PACE efflux transporter n=1 Tax=Maridesulfovibrio ferrireducens TaxID=246191 RepID=UPI001A187412|nr:PACE efflux transporter [Maridesulfovibrio ferrireducens]MBI9109835.1 PACE efflux transporter [Maridesulfovibrio ferrireducens]
MRTISERIRHTILFEGIALIIVIPGTSIITGRPPHEIGAMSIIVSIIAMSWNYIYNLGFDKILIKMKKPLMPRPAHMRICHALFFEVGLIGLMVPFFMYWFQMGALQALIFDAGIALFFLIYSYMFNLAYDHRFPVQTIMEELHT